MSEWRGQPCAYCGKSAIHGDHVVPKYLYKKGSRAREALGSRLREHGLTTVVASCGSCNWLKGGRKLVPPSWADKIPVLKELVPGPWRVWSGATSDAAFRETHA